MTESPLNTNTLTRTMVELRPNKETTLFGSLLWDKDSSILVLIQSDGNIIPLGTAAPRGEYGHTAIVIHEGFIAPFPEVDDDSDDAQSWAIFREPELEGLTLALQEIGAIATILVPTTTAGGTRHSVVELTADLGAGARPYTLLENLSTTLSPAINMAIVDELITVVGLFDSLTDPEELENIKNLILFRAKAHQRAAELALKETITHRTALSSPTLP